MRGLARRHLDQEPVLPRGSGQQEPLAAGKRAAEQVAGEYWLTVDEELHRRARFDAEEGSLAPGLELGSGGEEVPAGRTGATFLCRRFEGGERVAHREESVGEAHRAPGLGAPGGGVARRSGVAFGGEGVVELEIVERREGADERIRGEQTHFLTQLRRAIVVAVGDDGDGEGRGAFGERAGGAIRDRGMAR